MQKTLNFIVSYERVGQGFYLQYNLCIFNDLNDSDSDSDYLIIQQTQNYYHYIQHLITITNNDNYNNIKYKYQ